MSGRRTQATLHLSLAIPVTLEDGGTPALQRFAAWVRTEQGAAAFFAVGYREWAQRQQDPEGLAVIRAVFGAAEEGHHG